MYVNVLNMKTINKKTYLLYFLPFTLFSQSPFGPSSSSQKEEMPGMEQLDATRYISYDYQSTKINPLRDHHNGQKANYSRMLHDEANRNLFFRHENNKKLRAANKRVWDREHIFASAWEQSKTGLLSGVSWYSLPEEDKALYRQIYFENRIKKEPLRRYSTEDEMEISLAWARSATGRKTGVPWSKLTNAEREFHRNNYEASLKMRSMQPRDRNHPHAKIQLASLNPVITQDEYRYAWENNLQHLRSSRKPWNQLSSLEKSKFRKSYSVRKKEKNYDQSLIAQK